MFIADALENSFEGSGIDFSDFELTVSELMVLSQVDFPSLDFKFIYLPFSIDRVGAFESLATLRLIFGSITMGAIVPVSLEDITISADFSYDFELLPPPVEFEGSPYLLSMSLDDFEAFSLVEGNDFSAEFAHIEFSIEGIELTAYGGPQPITEFSTLEFSLEIAIFNPVSDLTVLEYSIEIAEAV
jgi:hypothetical protein